MLLWIKQPFQRSTLCCATQEIPLVEGVMGHGLQVREAAAGRANNEKCRSAKLSNSLNESSNLNFNIQRHYVSACMQIRETCEHHNVNVKMLTA